MCPRRWAADEAPVEKVGVAVGDAAVEEAVQEAAKVLPVDLPPLS